MVNQATRAIHINWYSALTDTSETHLESITIKYVMANYSDTEGNKFREYVDDFDSGPR